MMADEVDELRDRFGYLISDLPANPIVDEVEDLFEDMFTALRALRKDRERLDWLFGRAGGSSHDNGETWEVCMYVQCRGEMDGDMLCPPLDLRAALDAYMASEDAAMAAESARGEGE